MEPKLNSLIVLMQRWEEENRKINEGDLKHFEITSNRLKELMYDFTDEQKKYIINILDSSTVGYNL